MLAGLIRASCCRTSALTVASNLSTGLVLSANVAGKQALACHNTWSGFYCTTG